MSSRWTDGLARPHTRRQGLRALLAGAALTVPLARGAAPARAAGPNDCRKGCSFTAEQAFTERYNTCVNTFVLADLAFLVNPFLGADKTIQALQCRDSAIVRHKAQLFDCRQPNCPGFDPKAPGGPCDGCRDNCCTCQASPTGYICCVFACSDTEHNCCPS